MRLSKILVVGDIHCKISILYKVKKLLPEYDKVVFLGDYIDDWNIPPQVSADTLRQLTAFKLTYPDKIILLTGNHDFSEWFAGDFKCSGFNYLTHLDCQDFFNIKNPENDQSIFQFAWSFQDILFTHAGVTKTFWDEFKQANIIRTDKPYYMARALNKTFRQGINQPTNTDFQMFRQVGRGRGGNQTPSPIWADREELSNDPMPNMVQIVGHTPVHAIKHIESPETNSELFFCDTFSEAYIPALGLTYPIGNRTLLEIKFSWGYNQKHREYKFIPFIWS